MVAFISIVGKDCVYLSTHHEMGINTSAEEREKDFRLTLYKEVERQGKPTNPRRVLLVDNVPLSLLYHFVVFLRS